MSASTGLDRNNGFDMRSTEQFTSEQSIFHQHRDQNKLLIHIPALSPKSHHYPSLFLSTAAAATGTKRPLKMSKALLETTSKTSFNVGPDNVLFVSTLDSYWTRTTPYRMKRHTSSNGSGTQNSDNAINASTLTTRRYSHPDTNKVPMSTKPMIECPSIPCSTSSSSSSNNRAPTSYDMRRLSFQSDAASTELIRRFSSESTTSSLSSISSFILESHSKLHQQYQQQQQQKAQETSSDAQTSHPVALAHSSSTQVAEADAVAPTADTEKEPLDRDPGHACETMHSPSKEMQQIQGTNIKEEEDEAGSEQQLPIWADPIKVKENPTRFQYTKSYLQQRDMLNERSLPLIKPCVFHFSDTTSNRVTNHQDKQQEQYMSTVKPVFECRSVWEFAARWRAFKEKCNKKPSQLTTNQNIFCFIHGVEPMWEDPVNKDGGRLFVTVNDSQRLDELFEWILCAFVGGNFVEDGVVGVVVSKRFRGDRIEFWFDKSADQSKMPEFKNKLYALLASTCHDVIKAGRYKKHFN
ncbi:hypothetical protein MBANPS3_007129 [Mucor bainieri]